MSEGVSWKRIKAVLAEALAMEPEERTDFVREACGGDRELEREVHAYLSAERGGQALDRLSLELWTLPGEREQPTDLVGQSVDGHRILAFLGAGGMADVYEAEEMGGTRVALKLLRRGSLSHFATRRFDVERSGLRRLSHPRIARFRTSGLSSDGAPYYTMDLVKGETLDDYCDRRRLPLTERSRLLARVCDAVDHAHDEGIVHRDIKPSNVLVRPDGEPVLLDFGIAKLLGDEGRGDPGTVTREYVSLTPLYASPEQVEGEAVSPASDVFSLGAVGYRLAVGVPSSDLGRRKPTRPSELLPGDGPALDEVAEARGTTARELVRALRSGLDKILVKACMVRPSRRFRSAARLGVRLRRWADGRSRGSE